MEDNENISYENIPFEETGKYGFIKGFYASAVMVLLSPSYFFRKMHVNKGLKKPLMFLIIVLAAGYTANYIYTVTEIVKSPAEQMLKAIEEEPNPGRGTEILKYMLEKEPSPYDIPVGVLTGTLLLYLLSLYWHFVLRSMRAALNGFEATFRVFCYSSAVFLSALIPVTSPTLNMVVYIWWSYLMYSGISEAHEVSRITALRGLLIALFASFIPLIAITLLLFSA